MKCPRLSELPAPPAGKTGWPWTEESKNSDWLAKRSEWPRVSIVMPSYNQGQFIEESIRSVLLQGYPDLEFFVYDAASTDGGADIVKKYGSLFTFWVSEKDRGQSDAINKGLRKSTGKYFNWQNSDDVLTPCSLFKAVNALLEHPEASHVHGYRDVIYANGEPHSSSEKTYGPPTRLAPDVGNSISRLKTGTQPGGLMDGDLIVRIGGVDESMHFVMDMDILLKLSVVKPPLYVHEKLVTYRFHDDTKSHSSWTKDRRFEKLRLVENLFKMPEAQKYISYRKEAMSTARRYAAECSWMSGDLLGFVYHFLVDIAWTPLKGWDRRRALLYYLKERKKGLKMGAQG
ncbi:MAG: glycosyltransferase family 2 protein [Phycisphaerae bacterium]|nr:glycosyltransferase family 2 protein [Phycisphaerae bacterium]